MTRKKVRVAALSDRRPERLGPMGPMGPIRRPVLFLCKTPANTGRTCLRSASFAFLCRKIEDESRHSDAFPSVPRQISDLGGACCELAKSPRGRFGGVDGP